MVSKSLHSLQRHRSNILQSQSLDFWSCYWSCELICVHHSFCLTRLADLCTTSPDTSRHPPKTKQLFAVCFCKMKEVLVWFCVMNMRSVNCSRQAVMLKLNVHETNINIYLLFMFLSPCALCVCVQMCACICLVFCFSFYNKPYYWQGGNLWWGKRVTICKDVSVIMSSKRKCKHIFQACVVFLMCSDLVFTCTFKKASRIPICPRSLTIRSHLLLCSLSPATPLRHLAMWVNHMRC